jgi:hypothetical protein
VPEKPTGLVQGTLEMLVLKTLALQPMHGYGIAVRMEQISDGVFRVNPGSPLRPHYRLKRPKERERKYETADATVHALDELHACIAPGISQESIGRIESLQQPALDLRLELGYFVAANGRKEQPRDPTDG